MTNEPERSTETEPAVTFTDAAVDKLENPAFSSRDFKGTRLSGLSSTMRMPIRSSPFPALVAGIPPARS